MSITNTMFQHKMSRRTTWTAPFRAYTINGQPRKNPIHNQIDYILIDSKFTRFVTNARSYNNTTTISDHNMVIMNFRTEFSRINRPKTDKPSPINTANFRVKTINEGRRCVASDPSQRSRSCCHIGCFSKDPFLTCSDFPAIYLHTHATEFLLCLQIY